MNPPVQGPPVISFTDHDEYFDMVDIKVDRDEAKNEFIASATTGGKTFESRHSDKRQAIADLETHIERERREGRLFPGIF